VNDTTTTLIVGSCRNLQMVIGATTITTTAPAFQLEGQDGGGRFYAIGAPLTAIASGGASVTIANVHALAIRARCTTAGSGATLTYVMLKAF
jgi:hypothetical protein